MNSFIDIFNILLRIVVALVFGAIIGCERATKRHSAGLRTFAIVSMASSTAMCIDTLFLNGFSPAVGQDFHSTQFFPLLSCAVLIAVAILSGNSVLFSSRSQIKGLTTSITLWAVSILGLVCGFGDLALAFVLFIIIIVSLSLLSPVERVLKNRSNHFELHLELTSSSYLKSFVSTIRELGLSIDDIELNPAYANSGLSVYSIALTIKSRELKKYKSHAEIIQALSTLDYVHFVEEMRS